jgi:hypothetical protein
MIRAVIVVGVLGCSSKPAPEPEPSRPPEPATPVGSAATKPAQPDAGASAAKLPNLHGTVDGKPIKFDSALAVDEGDGTVELVFASFPYTCKEKLEGFRPTTFPDEVEVRLRVNHRLAKDGTLGWGIRGTYFDSTSSEKQDGTTPLPGAVIDPAAGATSKLTLDLTQKGPGDTSKALVVKGSAEVIGCGANPKRPPPRLPEPQPGAFIVLAGKKFPIAGAAYIEDRDHTRTLELATSEVKCVEGSQHVSSHFPDVSIELAWGKQNKLFRAVLGGTWIEDWAANQTGDIKLTAVPNRPAGGAKTMTVKLGGATTIAGYPASLEGTVKVTVCVAPK